MKAIRRLTSSHCARCARSISASPRLSNLRVKNKKSGGTKCETWRAASANAAFGDAANAYSHEITFADTGDGTPRLMRGAVVESLDEDGVKTANSYSMNGNVLVCETRKSCGSGESQFPVYETTETDATEGTLLRRTMRLTSNNAIIADERSTYDEKRRLRSTTYLDGTSLTNAYSCCRLLWSVDREGRKALRSAETGTDHLYYANEDVWLADVSTNGAYRVTQHFFDALGRETNTVVSVGLTPGEATSSTWRSSFAASGQGLSSLASLSSFESRSSTRYPYGGSNYSISTDARGAETVRRVDLIPNGEETCEAIFTNGVEVSRTKSRSIFGGAISTRREWGVSAGQAGAFENWTEQTRLSDYNALGCRGDYAITTNLGRRIFEEEQHGKDRADYGSYLTRNLAASLEPEYGSGLGVRQLEFCRRFYRTYPIANTLYSQLNWSQYKLLISIEDEKDREYYQLEAVNHCWTKREHEHERQIHSQLWERLCLSNDKEAVLDIARKERIMIEDDEFFIDLVFYNRLLRCFVVLELKTGKLTHQDLGQLQMYVNYYDRCERTKDENKSIGILLCRDENDSLVKMSLPEDNETILAAEYRLHLPSEEQLIEEVRKIEEEFKDGQTNG